jgi:acetyl esterase/lipase
MPSSGESVKLYPKKKGRRMVRMRCRLGSVWVWLVACAGFTVSPIEAQTPISRDLPSGVDVLRDLNYARYDERELRLDLYTPASGQTAPFVVVVVRGGGWRSGDKEGFGPMAAALAARGIPAVCIEYRASGEASFPAAVQDVKAAVRWLRANGATYELSTERIGAIGGSAGGHLVSLAGVTTGEPSLEGRGASPRQSSRLQAVVALAPATDLTRGAEPAPDDARTIFVGALRSSDPDLWAFASPTTHVDGSSAPLLLIHSEDDGVSPVNQSLLLAERYSVEGAPVELVLFPGAPHAFWDYEEWFGDSMDRAAAFFKRYLDPQ